MATIQPAVTHIVDAKSILWETLTESDAASPFTIEGLMGSAGCVQVTGTFGSATVVLQASNDGSNWVTLKDTAGNAISFTSAGMAEFSTAALYLRPSASGGSSQDLDITMVLR